MDPLVFTAVLLAAMMHASWNAVVKLGLDRFSSILLLALVQSAIALLLLPVYPIPAAASWPWLLASGLLHTGYKLFLIRAYAHGDLAQVYPLARGTAPLLVALVGAFLLGEAIGPWRGTAICAITFGVMVMSLRGGGDVECIPATAVAYALGTAGFTAAYTIADAVGARASGSASGFTLWMFVVDGAGCLASPCFGAGGRRSGRLPRLGARASSQGRSRWAPTGSRSGTSRKLPWRSSPPCEKRAFSSPCSSESWSSARKEVDGAGRPPA